MNPPLSPMMWFLFGFSIAALWIGGLSAYAASRAKESDFSNLKRRLKFYAEMLGIEAKEMGNELSLGQHKILLGILKKVEAKNAVLLVISIFVMGMLLRIMLLDQLPVRTSEREEAIIYCVWSFVSGLLLGVLASRIVGASHLGQNQFDNLKSVKNNGSEVEIKKEMQKDLMKNLLVKESQFANSIFALILSIALIIACGGVIPLKGAEQEISRVPLGVTGNQMHGATQ